MCIRDSFYVVGDLRLAQQVRVEHAVLHGEVNRQPVGGQHAEARAEVEGQPVVAGKVHTSNAPQDIETAVHGGVATEKDLSLIHISEPTRLLSISYAVF